MFDDAMVLMKMKEWKWCVWCVVCGVEDDGMDARLERQSKES
jgi:hypothetical protein